MHFFDRRLHCCCYVIIKIYHHDITMSKTKTWCCTKNNFVLKQVWCCTKSNLVSTKTCWCCTKKHFMSTKTRWCYIKKIFSAQKKLLLSRTARHKKRLFFAITCRDHSLCEAFVVSVTFDLLCAFVTQN